MNNVEVREAVNETKYGKAPGLDGFPVELLKKGGMGVSYAKQKNTFFNKKTFFLNISQKNCFF